MCFGAYYEGIWTVRVPGIIALRTAPQSEGGIARLAVPRRGEALVSRVALSVHRGAAAPLFPLQRVTGSSATFRGDL